MRVIGRNEAVLFCTATILTVIGCGGSGGSVIINPPQGITVSISPQNASVAQNGQVQFAAAVSGTSDHRISWSASGAGSIDPSGLFTAFNQQGSATVYASSIAQPTASASAVVTITTEPSLWVTWQVNGHRYQAVNVPEGISWTQARQAAANMGGYLASPTSTAENEFVFTLVSDSKFWVHHPGAWLGPWIGLYQPPGSPEPDGGWTWVSGETSGFRAWGPPPNNSVGVENYVHFFYYDGQFASTWNDYSDDGIFPGSQDVRIRGYVVEVGSIGSDAWVYWPVNGHSYKVLTIPSGIKWSDARNQALAQGADLVNIGGQAENDFVFSLLTDPNLWDLQEDTGIMFGPWIGLFQPPGSVEPAGGWSWVSGGLAAYTSWEVGEPNDGHAGFPEEVAHYAYTNGIPKPTWNDFPDSNTFPGGMAFVHGYVMERVP